MATRITPAWVVFFVCCMCTMLLLLYFFFNQLGRLYVLRIQRFAVTVTMNYSDSFIFPKKDLNAENLWIK